MKILLPIALALTLPALNVLAESPEQHGLAIAQEADRRDTGWSDQVARQRMILRDRQNQESVREIRIRTLEVQGDGDKTLVIFDSPGDVRGTAFLSYTHALVPDDQWLYLPSLKRIKRIASANKSGPFVGSEFAFEDISSQEVAKYRYKYLRDEKIDGRDAFVIERYPQYENSGYTKQTVWVDQEMYQPVKIDYYDRKGQVLKTLTIGGYQRYQTRYWRPERMDMVNHQTGKSTTILWSDYRLGVGLTDRSFDQNSLKSAR